MAVLPDYRRKRIGHELAKSAIEAIKEKGAEYDATIASLEKQIEEENVRTREIKEFEDYTKTNAYVEQIAHSKLGLVYPDETIFIDKDE